jgi:hypothetical protein
MLGEEVDLQIFVLCVNFLCTSSKNEMLKATIYRVNKAFPEVKMIKLSNFSLDCNYFISFSHKHYQ